MIFRAITNEGDWFFGAGKSSYSRDHNAIINNLITKLKTFKGECFYDQNIGVPWFDLIPSKNKDAVVLWIKAFMLEQYGIISVNELEYSIDTDRKMTITYDIKTIFRDNVRGVIII